MRRKFQKAKTIQLLLVLIVVKTASRKGSHPAESLALRQLDQDNIITSRHSIVIIAHRAG